MIQDFAGQGSFFANAVHELRTPMQTITGTIELIEETKLDKEQSEYIRQIKFSSDILLSLINDLLDFSKIRSGKIKIERIPVSPAEIAETTVDLISIEAHNKGLEIITDIDYSLPKTVWGDPTRIQQILLNFVKNAVKFTPKGYVCVRLSRTADKQKLRYEVIDSGIGVADNKKELIFQDFCQADDSTTRKFGGTGLGLSICKSLVTLMNGTIGISDNPEGGSIFWFELPLEVSRKEAETRLPPAVLNIPESTRILIVDDHPLARKSLLDCLTKLGAHNVETAASGEEALAKLRDAVNRHNPFTVALIDMIMPVMDGWRLSSEINADRNINTTKLYMMVPEGQMGSEAKMKMLDWFNGYLYKPIKRHLLVDTLNSSCNESLELEVAAAATEAIPVTAVKTAAEKPAETETSGAANEETMFPIKALIAEDHPINQKLLQTFLSKMGVTVFTANNGNEAVERIKEHPEIPLIFMDIQMPEKNGVEATDELRANGYKGVIVACTANSDESDFELYRSHDMNDGLVKPFKKQTVRQLLQKWAPVFEIEENAEEIEELEEVEELEPIGDNLEKADVIITEIWDAADMLDTVANDTPLAMHLVKQFIEQTRNCLLSAKEAFYEEDYDALAKAAHRMKGSSAAISAKALSESAANLEKSAKANNLKNCGNYMNEFQADFSRFEFLAIEQMKLWEAEL